jgi:hypothetical protein
VRFVQELDRPDHAHHGAYEIMKQPPPAGRLAVLATMRHRANIRDFFAYARRQAPGIFAEFPPETVSFWVRHGGKAKARSRRRGSIPFFKPAYGIFIALTVARLLFSAFGATPHQPAPEPTGAMAIGSQIIDPSTGRISSTPRVALPSPADVDNQALGELVAGQAEKARADFESVLARDPGNAEALFGRGLLRMRTGDDAGNRDKLAALSNDPGVRDKFASFAIPAADLMVYDTSPTILSQPSGGLPIPEGTVLDAPLDLKVRCLVSISGVLHKCASAQPVPAGQRALVKVAAKYIGTAKASPAKYKGSPVADAPILLSTRVAPRASS